MIEYPGLSEPSLISISKAPYSYNLMKLNITIIGKLNVISEK
jgi:hypothetical protein